MSFRVNVKGLFIVLYLDYLETFCVYVNERSSLLLLKDPDLAFIRILKIGWCMIFLGMSLSVVLTQNFIQNDLFIKI